LDHRPPSPRRPHSRGGRPAASANVSCRQDRRRPSQMRPPPREPKPSARGAEQRRPCRHHPWQPCTGFLVGASGSGKGEVGRGGRAMAARVASPPESPQNGATRGPSEHTAYTRCETDSATIVSAQTIISLKVREARNTCIMSFDLYDFLHCCCNSNNVACH
jgi:hypothetical protein